MTYEVLLIQTDTGRYCLFNHLLGVVLNVAFELIVVVEEGRTDVAQNLGIVVIGISQFVPVAGHSGGVGVVLCLLESCRNNFGIRVTGSQSTSYHDQAHNQRERGFEFLA